MIIPEFIPEAKWHYYSILTIFAIVTLYWVFLRNQIGPHSYFFNYSYPEKRRTGRPSLKDEPLVCR